MNFGSSAGFYVVLELGYETITQERKVKKRGKTREDLYNTGSCSGKIQQHAAPLKNTTGQVLQRHV
jgi:hypothetical protein